MKNFNPLGFGVYLSQFAKQKNFLTACAGSVAFTSLHIAEEFDQNYPQQVKEACNWLRGNGMPIVADVSRRTLQQLGVESLAALAQKYEISRLRIDYGFSLEEQLTLACELPIALNASTLDLHAFHNGYAPSQMDIIAVHNYYPRPETGLGIAQWQARNLALRQMGVPVGGFISGDLQRRGPLYLGLPTLEHQRNYPPLVSFMESWQYCDFIWIGDMGLSQQQLKWIRQIVQTGVLPIPVTLQDSKWEQAIFTIRPDSPDASFRLLESREYATQGAVVAPTKTQERLRGAVTMDNCRYGRYSGEIQIIKKDLPMDERVNLIGAVESEYLPLLDLDWAGKKIQLVQPT